MAYRKIEEYDTETTQEIAQHIQAILKLLGEDPSREGLRKTPERVATAMQFLTQGYFQDGETIVRSALFQEPYNHMVIVKDIELFSLCEHHMLPFYGKIHVAYIPDGKIIGLSKIPRIVEMYARRLQVQERLTEQVCEAVESILHPQGIAVLTNGLHMCSIMRGVKKESAELITTRFTGVFEKDPVLRDDFYRQIGLPEPEE